MFGSASMPLRAFRLSLRASRYSARRALEKRFRSSINRTIHEQIRKSRISVITRMLIDSTMSVSEIAFATVVIYEFSFPLRL